MFKAVKSILSHLRRNVLVNFLKKTGFWKLMYRWNKKSLQVILYHEISPEKPVLFKGLGPTMHLSTNRFKEHLYFLRDYFHFISHKELQLIKAGKMAVDDFGKPPVHLTFDDGFKGVYANALPVCRELNIPFTVFVNTGMIDNKKKMWLLVLSAAIQSGHKEEFINICRELGYQNFYQEDNLRQIIRKSITFLEGLHILKIVDELLVVMKQEGISANKFNFDLFMTSNELKQIDAIESFEVGDHGFRHLKLKGTDDKLLVEEVDKSQVILETILSRKVKSFSFPFARYGEKELKHTENNYSYIYLGGKSPNSIFEKDDAWVLRRCYAVKESDTPVDVINSMYI